MLEKYIPVRLLKHSAWLTDKAATRLMQCATACIRDNGFKLPSAIIAFHPKTMSGFGEFAGAIGYCRTGEIHLPEWDMTQLVPGLGRDRMRIIFHEFGHLLIERVRQYMDTGRLCAAFGSYGGCQPTVMQERDKCVSLYATSNPEEDIADTFMMYIAHSGRVPCLWLRNVHICRKWDIMRELKQVSNEYL